jgi:hypothetical protein
MVGNVCQDVRQIQLLESRMKGNFHVRLGAGEKLEIISKAYLSL